jgi:predicted enzyme related to lactoylglutathione lyase
MMIDRNKLMITKITHMTLFVHDQDEALRFYTEKIGFKIHTDAKFDELRWLTLHAPEQPDFELVLFLATTDAEKAMVGKQGAQKPFLTLETNDCVKDFERLEKAGVVMLEPPKVQPWGTAAACLDLYENVIYMCQPNK